MFRRFIPFALLALCTGCSSDNFFTRLGNKMSGKTPTAAVAKMEDKYFPDERYIGITELVKTDYGKHPPYTDRYKQIALNDPDWLVRQMAVRALTISRDKSATPIFIRSLSDVDWHVRMEGAKGLARVPDPNSIGPLIKQMNNPNEDRDARIAAAGALKYYKNLEVARALTNILDAREFGIAWQARRSLITMTGKDFRYDQGQWLDYITGPGKLNG